MPDAQPLSIPAPADMPRHPQQEITDLLAAALLRLRARHAAQSSPAHDADSESVGLGFAGQERVNTNPAQPPGVRP